MRIQAHLEERKIGFKHCRYVNFVPLKRTEKHYFEPVRVLYRRDGEWREEHLRATEIEKRIFTYFAWCTRFFNFWVVINWRESSAIEL